jgi:hypothetical protein
MRALFLPASWALIALLATLAAPASPGLRASDSEMDLLILGDSQTGGSWATSYFGDFLQKCLSGKPALRFAAYARGGTQMIQWTTSAASDSVPTVYRDRETPRKILGRAEVPVTLKRARSLLKLHHPKAVLLQFGDNLLSLTEPAIEAQTRELLDEVEAAGLDADTCFFATPTHEMAVRTRRNVPAKNLENTLKVKRAIERASKGRCTLLDGIALLANSPLLENGTLKRVAIAETLGCSGSAVNDNTHACGEAAKAWAEAVCQALP